MFADTCILTMDCPLPINPPTLAERLETFLALFTLAERLDILTHLQEVYLIAFPANEQPQALLDWLSTDLDYERLAARLGWH